MNVGLYKKNLSTVLDNYVNSATRVVARRNFSGGNARSYRPTVFSFSYCLHSMLSSYRFKRNVLRLATIDLPREK